MLKLFPGFSSLSFFPPLCGLPGQTCGFGRLLLRQPGGEQPGRLQGEPIPTAQRPGCWQGKVNRSLEVTEITEDEVSVIVELAVEVV